MFLGMVMIGMAGLLERFLSFGMLSGYEISGTKYVQPESERVKA